MTVKRRTKASPLLDSFANLMKVFADGGGSDPALENAIRSILALIGNQPELRFFVDGTPNCGHQAATIQMMKHLIDLTAYTGTITVVYTEIHKGSLGGTADKLALLLPRLDPRHMDTAILEYGTCKQIRFLEYGRRNILAGEMRLGFTGAADDMRINLAAELKVKYFVRLQPYLWDSDPSQRSDAFYVTSRIETASGKYFYPTESYPPFRSLPCRWSPTQCESVPKEVWTWYGEEQTFDPRLAVRTRNAQAVYEVRRENPRLRLWPIYGLHHFREHAPEIMTNLIMTAVQVQQAAPGPVLALVLNAPWDIPHVDAFIEPLADDLAAGSFGPFKAEFTRRFDRSSVTERRLISRRGYDASGQYADIATELRQAVEAGDGDVIVSVIGPVPGDVYNYFYAHSDLPGLFEGANSSSLALSLGRPFLQMTRDSAAAENPYPSHVGDFDFTEVAHRAHAAALQLRDPQCSAYIRGTGLSDPGTFLSALTKSTDFILETQQWSSDVSRYFRALGEHYGKVVPDKCLSGLLAMAISIDDE